MQRSRRSRKALIRLKSPKKLHQTRPQISSVPKNSLSINPSPKRKPTLSLITLSLNLLHLIQLRKLKNPYSKSLSPLKLCSSLGPLSNSNPINKPKTLKLNLVIIKRSKIMLLQLTKIKLRSLRKLMRRFTQSRQTREKHKRNRNKVGNLRRNDMID